MADAFSIAPLLEPVQSSYFVSDESDLGSVFMGLETTRDVAILQNSKGQYVGIVSPSKAMFSGSRPYTTKAKHASVKPAYHTPKSSIFNVAKDMVSLRTYMLPVFDEKKIVAHVIRSRSLLSTVRDNPQIFEQICSKITPRQPYTAPIDTTVDAIRKIMKSKNISRVVLVDEEGKLSGITTRADLRDAYAQPTPKQRYRSRGGHPRTYNLESNPERRTDAPIRNFYTQNVLFAYDSHSCEELLTKLLTSNKNSVVIVDEGKRPVGILSSRDILEALASLKPHRNLHIQIAKQDKGREDPQLERMFSLVEEYATKLDDRMPVMKVDLVYKQAKSPVQNIKANEVRLQVKLYDGRQFIASTSDRVQLRALKSALDLIDKQARRSEEH